MIIASAQNAVFKKLNSLLTAKGLKEHRQCLLAGARVTLEYIERHPGEDMFWVMRADHQLPSGNFANTLTLARELFATLDQAGSHHPLLCVPCPPLSPLNDLNLQKPAIYTGLGDPANLGAILRAALAFNVRQIVLLAESCHPFLPKSLRSSSGYALEMQYFVGPPIRDLDFAHLWALDMGGDPLWQSQLPKNFHFLVGEEGLGIPRHFPGRRLSIPMAHGVESLNAGVAAGIVMAEWQRQQQ